MSYRDVLRDTGNLGNMDEMNPHKGAAALEAELALTSSEELWELHTAWGTMNPLGIAALAVLKKREPEKFTERQLLDIE